MGASLRLFLRLYVIFQSILAFLMVSVTATSVGSTGGGLSWTAVLGHLHTMAADSVVIRFGFFLAPILAAFMAAHLQIAAVRKLGVPVTDENLKTRQHRTITLSRPFEESFSLCLWSVRFLERAEVEEETDLEEGVILVTQDINFREWGRRIRMDLTPDGDSRTTVHIHSRSLFPCVRLLDYGKNLQNILTILKFLSGYTDKGPPPASYGTVTGPGPTDGVN